MRHWVVLRVCIVLYFVSAYTFTADSFASESMRNALNSAVCEELALGDSGTIDLIGTICESSAVENSGKKNEVTVTNGAIRVRKEIRNRIQIKRPSPDEDLKPNISELAPEVIENRLYEQGSHTLNSEGKLKNLKKCDDRDVESCEFSLDYFRQVEGLY